MFNGGPVGSSQSTSARYQDLSYGGSSAQHSGANSSLGHAQNTLLLSDVGQGSL